MVLLHSTPSTDFQFDAYSDADDTHALRVHLCAGEVVIITIDPRTGRLNLRDTGDLAAAGRGPRFAAISEKLNESPMMLLDALIRLRLNVRWDFYRLFMLTNIGTDNHRSC